MTEEGGRIKREGGCSGSLKRLFSPPEETHNAKRPRTVNTLNTAQLPPIANIHSLREQTLQQEDREKDEQDSSFTVITEQKVGKTSERPSTRPDIHAPTTLVHKQSAQGIAPQKKAKEEEVDLKEKEATKTTVTSSDGDKHRAESSDKEQSEGTVVRVSTLMCFVYYGCTDVRLIGIGKNCFSSP